MDLKIPANSPVSGTDELLLLFLFFITSGYMYLEADSFDSTAALWPQMLAAFVLIGIVSLLIQNYLPEPLQRVVAESVSVIEVNGDAEMKESEEEITKNESSLFVVLTSITYIAVGYLIGLVWATPLFVAIYTAWFQLKWYIIIGLSTLTFVIAYTFMTFMHLPLDRGVIFGGI